MSMTREEWIAKDRADRVKHWRQVVEDHVQLAADVKCDPVLLALLRILRRPQETYTNGRYQGAAGW